MKLLTRAWNALAPKASYFWNWMTTYKARPGEELEALPGKIGKFVKTLPETILFWVLLGVVASPFIWFSNTSSGSVNAITGEITEDVCPFGSWIKPASILVGNPLLYRQPGIFGGFSEEAIPQQDIKSVKITSGWRWDRVILERDGFRSIRLYFLKTKKETTAIAAYELLIHQRGASN